MCKTALNAAESDDHVVSRNYAFRSLTCVLICECSYVFVRVQWLDGVCNLVYKPYDESRMSSILLFYGPAFLALTRKLIVTLRHAVDPAQRIRCNSFLHLFYADLQDFRIAQTKLCIWLSLSVA